MPMFQGIGDRVMKKLWGRSQFGSRCGIVLALFVDDIDL